MTLDEFAEYLVDLCRSGKVDGSTPVMVTDAEGERFVYAEPQLRTLRFWTPDGSANRRTVLIHAGDPPSCNVTRQL